MRSCRGFVALTVLLTAACSSSATKAKPSLVEAWKNSTITPIGQPVAVGDDTVVVYGTVDKDLYLYGVAVTDGSIRWRQAASPSDTVSGTNLVPTVFDGHVVYFRPDPKANLAARLVVATPENGSDLLVSDPAFFLSHPAQCSDGKDICVSARDSAGNEAFRRFSVGTAGSVPGPASAPPGSRFIGEGLVELGQRQPEVLAALQNGGIRWRAPLARYFPAGYSTDYGWSFELYKSDQLYVGSVGRPDDQRDASTVVVDLAKVDTVAIEATTGVLDWQSEGASFACDLRIELERTVAGGRSELWPVRCRMRGTLHYDRVANKTTYTGLDVIVEGFDVPTGKAIWSLPLGPAETFMREETRATAVSDSEVLVQSAAGPVIVDLGSGGTRPPGKAEAFWCTTNAIFSYRESWTLPNGGTSSSWRGGTLLNVCAADGSPTTAAPSSVAASLGAMVGGRSVLATPTGLVAYDRPAR